MIDLKSTELQHCTLQLWISGESNQDGLYMGDDEQGIVLCDLPLTADRKDQIDALDTAFKEGNAFDMLLAIATGYWPIILAATTTDYPYRPNPDSGSSHS